MAPALTSPWIATVGFAWFSWKITTRPFMSSTLVARAAWVVAPAPPLIRNRFIVADGARPLPEIGVRRPDHVLGRHAPDPVQVGFEISVGPHGFVVPQLLRQAPDGVLRIDERSLDLLSGPVQLDLRGRLPFQTVHLLEERGLERVERDSWGRRRLGDEEKGIARCLVLGFRPGRDGTLHER